MKIIFVLALFLAAATAGYVPLAYSSYPVAHHHHHVAPIHHYSPIVAPVVKVVPVITPVVKVAPIAHYVPVAYQPWIKRH
uniref:Cuticle protein n=1 Tax=Megaselia scalaris TaxID=36166 RepID=T1GFP5_MEGSC